RGGLPARAEQMTPIMWARPTRCEGWVARDVVRHLVEWIPEFLVAAGGPALPEGPSVDDDPVCAWTTLSDGVQELVDDPSASAMLITHPRAGTHRLDEAVAMFFVGDVLVHTWDLARAGGLDETLDPAVLRELLGGMRALDEVLRSSGQYGARVAVPADADEQTRLIAFTGRRP